MRYSRCAPLFNLLDRLYILFTRKAVVLSCCALLTCVPVVLTACGGSAATTYQPAAHSSVPPHVAPTPTKPPTPTPVPTTTPTPQPQPVAAQPVATQPPPAPILDVAPASMSIVGHLDCNKTASAFFCQAAVISEASNQTTLSWMAFANISGVGFSPAQGSLAPGTRVILTISIPVQECSGTFFFRGPANTHTISWQC